MPRPRKHRRVCAYPRYTSFKSCEGSGKLISMTYDEYETIRLIDFVGLTQEQCAVQMAISRTTVQSVYANARQKLAQCIIQGCSLQIGGGDVRFCEHNNSSCGSGCCRRKEAQCEKEGNSFE